MTIKGAEYVRTLKQGLWEIQEALGKFLSKFLKKVLRRGFSHQHYTLIELVKLANTGTFQTKKNLYSNEILGTETFSSSL